MIEKKFALQSGLFIPSLGLGTWQLRGQKATRAVERALKLGYRLIDTADIYGNHHEVGEAIRASGVNRNEIFLTTKIWHNNLHADGVRRSITRFLHELKTDYLDLVLIHWPNQGIPVEETLKAMEQARQDGFVKAIGVSNFTIEHLKHALASGIPITNNQVEYHPTLNQEALRMFCEEHNIVITAYSPLGRGRDVSLPVVKELAQKYQRSESQIILNWLIGKKLVAIPKASSETHLVDNLAALEFSLSDEDRKRIDDIDNRQQRLINPPFAEFDGGKRQLSAFLGASLAALLKFFR